MTQPALASIEAFEVRLGRTLGDDEDRAQAALEDASALIRLEANKTWVTGNTIDSDVPDVIVSICLRAARRAFENPSELSSEAIGNFQQAWRIGNVYLTSDEITVIQHAVGGGSGMVSVSASTPWSFLQTDYIPVVGQDEPMPYSEPSGFNPLTGQ